MEGGQLRMAERLSGGDFRDSASAQDRLVKRRKAPRPFDRSPRGGLALPCSSQCRCSPNLADCMDEKATHWLTVGRTGDIRRLHPSNPVGTSTPPLFSTGDAADGRRLRAGFHAVGTGAEHGAARAPVGCELE